MLVLFLASCLAATESPKIRVRIEPGKDSRHVAVVAVLPDDLRAEIPSGKLAAEKAERWLQCRVLDEGKEGPAILGSYERRGETLRFVPRYPFEPGRVYRIHFGKARTDYRVPLPPLSAPALVEKVFPTGNVLPANHLRFHIFFSRPMRGGQEIFDHIRLLDAKGNPVHEPWLRDELWDDTDRHLILYVHPGRIKWGVLLRMLLGPVLAPDQEYTLVIDAAVLDANGRPLGKEYRKKIRTTPEDRTWVNTRAWRIVKPNTGTKQPVIVEFGKSLDQASLKRFLTVVDSRRKTVAGSIRIGSAERSWSFQPELKWGNEEYTVKIDPRLEDTAGNTPGRPFDVDRQAPAPPAPLLHLRFRPTHP